MRPATLLKSVALSAALLTGGLTCAALAVSTHTVVWDGLSTFNDSAITFTGFQANQLIDIKGSGQYEACCSVGKTYFTLDLYYNGGWNTVFELAHQGR